MKNMDRLLFTTIAPVYGLFFNYQKRRYRNLLREVQVSLDLPSPTQILDVGCGTGALASVLYELGHQVTGIDASWKMIDIARRKTAPEHRLSTGGRNELPFQDKSFQVAGVLCCPWFAAGGKAKIMGDGRVSSSSFCPTTISRGIGLSPWQNIWRAVTTLSLSRSRRRNWRSALAILKSFPPANGQPCTWYL